MAEPELKQRSSRESVAKEKMEGTYRAHSLSCGHHMAQGCVNPPCAGYDATLPEWLHVAVWMHDAVLFVMVTADKGNRN